MPESGSISIAGGPKRIICLTEETTETLYLLGEQDRIVGISGFTVRPPQARREKPRVSAFTSAKIDKIIALKPDLVLGFSDLQAEIAAECIRAGLDVMVFNQRSIAQIFSMILTLGRLVDAGPKTLELVNRLNAGLEKIRVAASVLDVKPVVYFEEWNNPMISGIRWVSELIELAGGQDCFAELALYPDAKRRIIANADEVINRNPDIIIGSWCGKKFRPEQLCSRPGWDKIKAVANSEVYEIKSANILQPGPACLTDGLQQISSLIQQWSAKQNPAAVE